MSPSAQEIVTLVPVLSFSVACVAPTTAGMPSSRATMAAWQVRPPLSVMTPAAIFMTGSQSGLVAGATRISPGLKAARSRAVAMRRVRPEAIFSPTARPVTMTGAAPLESVGLVDVRRTLRGHRLGPRLNDIELAVGAVLGPFDVHRHGSAGMLRIMRLDPHRDVGKVQHLRVGNAEFPPLGVGHVPGQRRMAAAAACRRSFVSAWPRAGGAARSETLARASACERRTRRDRPGPGRWFRRDRNSR